VALGFRLKRQSLLHRAPPGSLVEVAGRICGLHAQVLSAADLQAWSRVEGHARGDLERALWEERSLVKTWLMRGTLHAVPAADLPVYVGALHNRGEWGNAWLRAFGATATQMERLIEAIGDALDGGCLTRAELTAAVTPTIGRALATEMSSSWGTFFKPAARRGVLCFGPSRGQNVTFVRADQWLGLRFDLGRDEARAELLRRYLRAFAPAGTADFKLWLGSSRAVPQAWADLADELVEVEPKRFALAVDVPRLATKPTGVKLLPGFDGYVLHPNTDRPVPPEFMPRVSRTAGWISPTIVERGRVVGTWRHAAKAGVLDATLEPFAPLSKATTAAAHKEIASLASYLGCEVV
jgi:Winged helix DNA-binding domain